MINSIPITNHLSQTYPINKQITAKNSTIVPNICCHRKANNFSTFIALCLRIFLTIIVLCHKKKSTIQTKQTRIINSVLLHLINRKKRDLCTNKHEQNFAVLLFLFNTDLLLYTIQTKKYQIYNFFLSL